MKKLFVMLLFLGITVLPIFAHDCNKYSQFAASQQLLFYMQENNIECVKSILGPDPKKAPPLYWKKDDMCVDLLFYWVHKGKQNTFEAIAGALISHGADMTKTYCRQSAIAAAADLAITDINKKGTFDDFSNPIIRFEYLLAVGSKIDAVNRISPNFLQYSITKTGRITNRFVQVLLDYGIYVTEDDITYAHNNGYWTIYDMLRETDSSKEIPMTAGKRTQNNLYAISGSKYRLFPF